MYLLTSTFLAVAIGIQLVLFNLYVLELDYDENVVGQIAALSALGVALGGLPAGLLYDRFGGKISFGLSTIGIVFTTIFLALSASTISLSFWSLINGLANSIFFVSIFPFITDQSTPNERSYLYGFNLAVWSGFRVFGNLFAGYLPGIWKFLLPASGSLIQYRNSLLVAAIFSVLALIPIALISSDKQEHQTRSFRDLVPSAQSRNSIIKSAFLLALFGIVIGLTQPFYNVYFKRSFLADTVLIGQLFSLSELTALISALFLPSLVARLGLVSAPAAITILAAPFTFVMGLPLTLTFIASVFLVRVGLQWLGSTPFMNLVMEVVEPNDRGTMSGVRLVTSYGAQALAGAVGGWIVISAGYTWLFTIAALIQLISGGCVWLLYRNQRTELETSTAVKMTA